MANKKGSEKVSDRDFVAEQVKIFEAMRQHYDVFRDELKKVLEYAVQKNGLLAFVQVRSKTVPSFAEKCLRKRSMYPKPAYQFGDLCGARVIVESQDKIEPIRDFILRYFEIEESSSENVADRLHAPEFGYQSWHFTVSFRDGVNYPELGGAEVPPELLKRRSPGEARREGLSPGPVYRAEIQVRTLVQHAWASLVHDNLYKSELKSLPPHLVRDASRISALLEDADHAFVHLLQGVDLYRSCFGAYMKRGDIETEISTLDVVRGYDASCEGLAHRIAKLAMSIDDWQKTEEVLDPFAESPTAAVLRDLGWAKWRLGKKEEGQLLLNRAVEISKDTDADAFCTLGDTYYEDGKRHQALKQYEKAYRIDPVHPRALVSYVRCEIIENKNVAFLPFARPDLQRAIERSLERARYGMHLPWAWYDIGFLHLLLGNPYEGLTAYAKAVTLSLNETHIEEARQVLDEVQMALARGPEKLAERVRWARWLLSAAIVAKLHALEAEARTMPENIAADEYARKIPLAVKGWILQGNDELDGRSSLPTPVTKGAGPLFDANTPVVIVAGGCDESVQARMREYRLLVHQAFEGYHGDIISGGTTAGIAGIVGDLSASDGGVRKIAYHPKRLLPEDRRHDGYNEYRVSDQTDYDPSGPIQVWIDLLAAGVPPSSVKLFGINGGQISAFEYRLALAMGAQVGILHGSGREAAQIAADPDWNDPKRLLLLPTDQETVTAFLQPAAPLEMIGPEAREVMARHAHHDYKEKQQERYLKQHPPMASWENLPETYRHANFAQVDHIGTKLSRMGLCLRRTAAGTPVLFEFDKKQKETMAEMEHGRWNTERLQQGWTYGEKKDEEAKKTPHIIAWRDLSDEVKSWDVKAVEDIPKQLAEIGYEIYKPE